MNPTKLRSKDTVGEVRMTKKYDKFNFMTANRDTNKGHIQDLKAAIEANPHLVTAQPILVNEKMQIIDGQHRFIALSELHWPVPYVILPGLTVVDARKMNILHKGWTPEDYAKSYAVSGLVNYQEYLLLREDYGFNHSVTVLAIEGADRPGMYSDFRNGDLVIEDISGTKDRLDKLSLFKEMLQVSLTKDLVEAIFTALNVEGFNWEHFLAKYQAHPELMQSYTEKGDYLRAMEAIYNHSKRHPLRLF